MNSATTLSSPPPKRVPASGLFGAFVAPKPVQPAVTGNQDCDEFVDDFLAGTHAHPHWEEQPARK